MQQASLTDSEQNLSKRKKKLLEGPTEVQKKVVPSTLVKTSKPVVKPASQNKDVEMSASELSE